jgi:hypothetical protein
MTHKRNEFARKEESAEGKCMLVMPERVSVLFLGVCLLLSLTKRSWWKGAVVKVYGRGGDLVIWCRCGGRGDSVVEIWGLDVGMVEDSKRWSRRSR